MDFPIQPLEKTGAWDTSFAVSLQNQCLSDFVPPELQ